VELHILNIVLQLSWLQALYGFPYEAIHSCDIDVSSLSTRQGTDRAKSPCNFCLIEQYPLPNTISAQFSGTLLLVNFLHTCSDKKTLKKWFFIDKTVG
jgi:hypothetical protein